MAELDTRHIDLLQLCGGKYKKHANTNGGEWVGACPFCGGDDRFHIWNQPRDNKPRMWCRACGFSGNAISFIMRKENLPFKEACEKLRVDLPKLVNTAKKTTYHAPVIQMTEVDESKGCFLPKWQDAAETFCLESWDMLSRSDEAQKAREYLYGRGINDTTILRAGLGYNPKDRYQNWGLEKDVFLPRGIVIPWSIHRFYWRVNIRRPVTGKEQRYLQPAGCSSALYGAQYIMPGCIAIMTEGEFDALLLRQQIPQIAVVATGSDTGARQLRWITRVSQAFDVMLAFDADEAGDRASLYWTTALGANKTLRLRPTVGKDITDMVKAGIDLREWVRGEWLKWRKA